jgi:hypothetical protein
MREYMQIGLQYSIESLSSADKMREKEDEKERSVHSIPIKKSTIRGKERKREDEKKRERRKEGRRQQQTEALCLHISIALGG